MMRKKLSKMRSPIRTVVETCEPRRLLSTVAPAFADQIGLTGVVAQQTSFEDNFDGTSLDKTKWQVRDGPRWRAYKDAPIDTFSYTGEASLDVRDGALTIVGFTDPVTGRNNAAMIQTAAHFSDASRNSPVPPATLLPGYSGDFSQTYGYWESRAKFSSMPGQWAAFWVHSYRMVEVRDDPTKVGHPEVFGTEMDVAEHAAIDKGADASYKVDHVVHADGYNGFHLSTSTSSKEGQLGPSYTQPDQFHVYGMLWSPTAVRFYVDGNLVKEVTDPRLVSKVPEMVILSMDIGASNSLEPGKGANNNGYIPEGGYGTKETSQARATFDYVRVWPLAGVPTVDPSTPSSASGIVYNETDYDGYYEPATGESGRGGATVFADYDLDGVRDGNEPATTTASDGTWRLDGLPAHQRISIRVAPPAGYTIVNRDAIATSFLTEPGLDHAMTYFAITPGSNPPIANDPYLTGTYIGTAGSNADSGNTGPRAFDSSLATYVDLPNANGGWSGLDLGSATQVTQIRYAPRPGFESRMVGGKFQGSNVADFSSGVVTFATVAAAPAAGVFTALMTGSTDGYRYVRYLGPDGSYGNVTEVQFFGVGGTPPTTTNPPPTDPPPATTETKLAGSVIGTSGSWNNVGNTGAKAFDGDVTSYVDFAQSSGGWTGLDLGAAAKITTIKYAPRAGLSSRMVGGRFQASNVADFSSGVVTLATITARPIDNALTAVAVTDAGTYRYVRYLGPDGSYCNIGEAQFFGTAGTPPTTTNPPPTTTESKLTGGVIGTAGSWNNVGNTGAKAFDGDLSSYVDFAQSSGGWAGLDLGAASTITTIKYAPRPGLSSRMVGGRFQASNVADFSSGVVTLATVTARPTDGVLSSLAVTDTSSYRYVRYLGPDGSYCNVGEVQFFGTAGTTTTPPATTDAKLAGSVIGTSGSWNNVGNTVAKAFDGDVNTYVDLAQASGGWAGLDLGSARQITRFFYAPRAGLSSRMVGGRFQGSNVADFSSGVADLATITTRPADGVLSSIAVTNGGSFRYVRYIGPNGSYGNVAEIQAWGL